MQLPGVDAGVVHEGLIVHPQRALARWQHFVAEGDVDPALRDNRPVGRRRLVPIAMDQPCPRGLLLDSRPIQLRNIEVAQRTGRNIHVSANRPRASCVGVEHPGHVVRPRRDRLGNLHKHTDDSYRSAVDAKHVTHPPPVEPYIRSAGEPLFHTGFIPPSVIFLICAHSRRL